MRLGWGKPVASGGAKSNEERYDVRIYLLDRRPASQPKAQLQALLWAGPETTENTSSELPSHPPALSSPPLHGKGQEIRLVRSCLAAFGMIVARSGL